jgi:spore coat polysaccharide biosynthesis protein SpsF
MDFAILLQARMGSTRTPGKVGFEICGFEMLYHQIQRLIVGGFKDIIVATTRDPLDNKIEAIAKKCNVKIFRGSENDVLDRYYTAAKQNNVENIIRVCGDDPLIDPAGIAALIKSQTELPTDFITTSHKKGWIYGTTAELFTFQCLEFSHLHASTKIDREHVNPFMKRSENFEIRRISPQAPHRLRPEIYLSVDYPQDLDLVTQIFHAFNNEGKIHSFSQDELIDLYDSGTIRIENTHLHNGFND